MSYYDRPSISKWNTLDEVLIWPCKSEQEYLDSFLICNWKELEYASYRNSRIEVLSTFTSPELSKMIWEQRKNWSDNVAQAFERELNWRTMKDRPEKEDLQKLKESVDIMDVVQHYVGQVRWRHWALLKCPFDEHKDKTSSFSVNQQRWFFKCFGCNRQWTQLDFIMNVEHCDLKAAIQKLKSFL